MYIINVCVCFNRGDINATMGSNQAIARNGTKEASFLEVKPFTRQHIVKWQEIVCTWFNDFGKL